MYICIGFQRQAFSTMVPMWKAHSSSRRTVAGTFYLGSLLPQVIYKWYMHLTVHVCIYTIDRKSKHAVHPSVHVLHNIVMLTPYGPFEHCTYIRLSIFRVELAKIFWAESGQGLSTALIASQLYWKFAKKPKRAEQELKNSLLEQKKYTFLYSMC